MVKQGLVGGKNVIPMADTPLSGDKVIRLAGWVLKVGENASGQNGGGRPFWKDGKWCARKAQRQ